MKKYDFITKELLIKEYNKSRKPKTQIAKELGCSETVIRKKLIKFGIYIRNKSEAERKKKYSITKEFLMLEYSENKKSPYRIARELGCSVTVIRSRLIEFGIPIRNLSEATIERLRDPKNHPMYGKPRSEETKAKMRGSRPSISGEKNYNFKHGYCCRGAKFYCKTCKVNEIHRDNFIYGNRECRSCAKRRSNSLNTPEIRRKSAERFRLNNPSTKPENRKRMSLRMGGTGIPYENSEYGAEFDSALKEKVRFRDKYKCQLCGCSQLENGKQLSVHHIDYNKKNCKLNNLIALCMRCHLETTHNRKDWTVYFQDFLKSNNRKGGRIWISVLR